MSTLVPYPGRLGHLGYVGYVVLLGFYTALVLLQLDTYPKDEITYLTYAANLLDGHFAPAGTEFLWCGPGYPLLLTPFLAVSTITGGATALLAVKLLNAVLLAGSVLLFHRTLLLYQAPRQAPHQVPRRAAYITLAFALYWPFYDQLPRVMTEVFAVFLITAALHSACHLFRGAETSRPRLVLRLVLTAFLLAYLALTKVLFGYVLLVTFALGLLAWLTSRVRGQDPQIRRRATIVTGLALVFCLPYLAYTCTLTGKPFYWATSGGMQLYWMSTPHEAEKGDWINYLLAAKSDPTDANPVIRHHGALFGAALGFGGPPGNPPPDPSRIRRYEDEPWERMVRRLGTRQDAMFTAAALDNIAAHPGKFARNWLHNVSRMLTDAPYSYRTSGTFWEFGVPNTLLLVLLAHAIARGLARRREAGWKLPREFAPIAVFVAIYLTASSGLSAYPRQFYIAVPFFAWWAALPWFEAGHPPDDKGGTAPGCGAAIPARKSP